MTRSVMPKLRTTRRTGVVHFDTSVHEAKRVLRSSLANPVRAAAIVTIAMSIPPQVAGYVMSPFFRCPAIYGEYAPKPCVVSVARQRPPATRPNRWL